MTNPVADNLEARLPNIPFLLDRENLRQAVDEIKRLQQIVDTPDQITVPTHMVQQLVQLLDTAVNNPFAFNNLVTQAVCSEIGSQLRQLVSVKQQESQP